jgi:hypothetical protein
MTGSLVGPDLERARAWNLLLLATAGLIAVQIGVQRWVINHDAALYLDCGIRLASGQRPYVDFLDLNPPLIMYLSVLPALLARALSIHVIVAFHLLVFALALASALACRRLILRSALGLSLNESRGFAFILLLGSFFLLRTAELDWGQREHLFILLYMPFFLSRWIRRAGGTVGPTAALYVGLGAGIGASLKPHFVLIALGVELIHLIASRRFRSLLQPEFLVFAGTGVAYAGHFLLLPADIRDAFFIRWLPMIREGYGAYNEPWNVVLLRPGVLSALLLLIAALAVVHGIDAPRAGLARLFIAFGLFGLAGYFIQQKGWSYQQLPALFGGMMALLVAFSARASEKSGPQPTRWPDQRLAVLVLIGAAFASATLVMARARDGFRPWPDPGIGQILHFETQPGDAILMISTSVGQIYPLRLQVGRPAGSRYLWTFPLPMIYASERGPVDAPFPFRSRAVMEQAELHFLEDLGEDIAKNRPRLIMIDAYDEPQGCPAGFTLPAYFEAAGFLAGEMNDYNYWTDVFGWQVYRRVDDPTRVTGNGSEPQV